MIKWWKNQYSKLIIATRSFLVAVIGKRCINLLMMTCKMRVEGEKTFCTTAEKEKTFLLLWHNRLLIMPWVLSFIAPQFTYAALVSNSKDGRMLNKVIHSYPQGRTILVPHNRRYEALRALIQRINEKKDIVVITPDGPRGPIYEMKPGAALAAIETGAHVFCLSWEASHYWELKTWDKMRIPKPFSTITLRFSPPSIFDPAHPPSLEEAKLLFKEILSKEV